MIFDFAALSSTIVVFFRKNDLVISNNAVAMRVFFLFPLRLKFVYLSSSTQFTNEYYNVFVLRLKKKKKNRYLCSFPAFLCVNALHQCSSLEGNIFLIVAFQPLKFV